MKTRVRILYKHLTVGMLGTVLVDMNIYKGNLKQLLPVKGVGTKFVNFSYLAFGDKKSMSPKGIVKLLAKQSQYRLPDGAEMLAFAKANPSENFVAFATINESIDQREVALGFDGRCSMAAVMVVDTNSRHFDWSDSGRSFKKGTNILVVVR